MPPMIALTTEEVDNISKQTIFSSYLVAVQIWKSETSEVWIYAFGLELTPRLLFGIGMN